MKIFIALIAVIVLSFTAFGQTKKPVKRVPKSTDKPKIYGAMTKNETAKVPVATQKVFIIKNDGEVISGKFVGGNTESITVNTEDSTINLRLDEIQRITFAEVVRIGTRNADTTDLSTNSDNYYRGSANSEQSDAPKKISGGVLNGKAETLVTPEYPAAARAVRATGAVNVQVTIDEQGAIISAAAVSGHPLLRQAAEKAALASKFVPTTLQGQPVQIVGIIIYNFVP